MIDLSEKAVFETTMGDFEFEYYRDKAPKTVEAIVDYVKEGFYNDTLIHRVVKGFVVQAGIYDLEMNKKEVKGTLPIESSNGLQNKREYIAMARMKDPNSAEASWFVNLVDNDRLNYTEENLGYTVFGKVVSGMETFDKIAEVEVEIVGKYGRRPLEKIVVKKAYMK